MPSMGETAFYSVGWWWRCRQRGLGSPSEGNLIKLSDAEIMWFKSFGFYTSEWRCLPWTSAPSMVVNTYVYWTYYVPGTVLSDLHAFSHRILTIGLCNRYDDYPHFTDEGSWVMRPKSHSFWDCYSLALGLWSSDFEASSHQWKARLTSSDVFCSHGPNKTTGPWNTQEL